MQAMTKIEFLQAYMQVDPEASRAELNQAWQEERQERERERERQERERQERERERERQERERERQEREQRTERERERQERERERQEREQRQERERERQEREFELEKLRLLTKSGSNVAEIEKLFARFRDLDVRTPRPAPRPSAASLSSPSGAPTSALPDLLHILKFFSTENDYGTHFRVRVNGTYAELDGCTDKHFKDLVADVVSAETMRATCGLIDADVVAEENLTRLLSQLTFKEEKSVQQALGGWLKRNHGSDTSEGTSSRCPDFLNKTLPSNYFRMTAKPDGTCLQLPLYLEVKPQRNSGKKATAQDWKLLKQAVERVAVRLTLSGFLSRAFCVASTGRHTWVVSGVRRLRQSSEGLRQSSEGQTQVLDIMHVGPEEAGSLWASLVKKAEADQTFFLTRDGPLLIQSLTRAKLSPALCRILWKGGSSSSVYSVTPPSLDAQNVIVVQDHGAEVFAIKVIHDHTFQREADALKLLTSPRKGSKVIHDDTFKGSFYALGSVPAGGSLTLFQALPEIECISPQLAEGWWNFDGLSVQGPGGCILMRHGVRTLTPEATREDWANALVGATKSLRLAHSRGVLHCDIRAPNFVCFDDGWQLIDYGLSMLRQARGGRTKQRTKAKFRVRMPGLFAEQNRSKRAGPRVRALLALKQPILWTTGDDWEMLLLAPYQEWKDSYLS